MGRGLPEQTQHAEPFSGWVLPDRMFDFVIWNNLSHLPSSATTDTDTTFWMSSCPSQDGFYLKECLFLLFKIVCHISLICHDRHRHNMLNVLLPFSGWLLPERMFDFVTWSNLSHLPFSATINTDTTCWMSSCPSQGGFYLKECLILLLGAICHISLFLPQ